MRRLVVAVVVLTSMAQAAPALADDLQGFMERASAAEYAGEQLITCTHPDGETSQLLDIRQREGTLVVQMADETVVAERGELASSDDAGEVRAMRVSSSNRAELAGRYQVVESGLGLYLNRTVDQVEVREGTLVRARFEFDRQTGAMLRTEVNNADGSTYCLTRFLDFTASAPDLGDVERMTAGQEVEVLVRPDEVDPAALPATLAGFERLDVYAGPEESVIGYYGDGLFSFTVLHSLRPVSVAELADAPPVEIGGDRYQRRFGPAQVVLAWESSVGGYAMIGDMPLDVQEAVLGELPDPGRPGLFVRWWRRLFG